MSTESSFFKDRPANIEEARNLEEGTPNVHSIGRHEDIFRIEAIDPGAEEKTIETQSGHELRGLQSQTWCRRLS